MSETPQELVTQWRKLAQDYDTEELTDANLALRRCARQLEASLAEHKIPDDLLNMPLHIAAATGSMRALVEQFQALGASQAANGWIEGICMAVECLNAAMQERPLNLRAALGWAPEPYETVDDLIRLAEAGDTGAASMLTDICEGEDESLADPS